MVMLMNSGVVVTNINGFTLRQKSTGMLWVNDGNYGTYGGRGSRSQNGYWYNSGGIHGMFSHLRGPKYVRYIAGMNENRVMALTSTKIL